MKLDPPITQTELGIFNSLDYLFRLDRDHYLKLFEIKNGTELIEEIVNATDNTIYKYCEHFLENYLGFGSEAVETTEV